MPILLIIALALVVTYYGVMLIREYHANLAEDRQIRKRLRALKAQARGYRDAE